MTLAPQGRSQVAEALASPQPWRLWITAHGWRYQFAQIIERRGIARREFPPTASSTNPTRRDMRRHAPQFSQTSPDRAPCHPGHARQRRHAAPSYRPRFGSRKPTQPARPYRIKRCVAQLYGRLIQHTQMLPDPQPAQKSPLKSRCGYPSTDPRVRFRSRLWILCTSRGMPGRTGKTNVRITGINDLFL